MTPKVRLTRLSRVAVAIVTTLVAIHMALVTFNAMPDNSLQDSAPSAVTGYGDPLFQQSWRLFAPNPIRADRTFWVRGLYQDEDGNDQATEWVNWTAVESDLKHTWHPFPPRSWPVAYRFTSTIRGRIHNLSGDAREAADGNYVDGDVYGRLTRDLREAGMSGGQISAYLRNERAATGLSSAAIQALHPEMDFRGVQFRIGSQPLPDFEDRTLTGEEREAARPETRFMSVGWRALIPPSDGQLEAFTTVIEEAGFHE